MGVQQVMESAPGGVFLAGAPPIYGARMTHQGRCFDGYTLVGQFPHQGSTERVRFESGNEVECTIRQVKDAATNYGEPFVDVARLLAGLTSVELIDQGTDSAAFRTIEALMKPPNIVEHIEAERAVAELNVESRAGSRVTAMSHCRHEFPAGDSGVGDRLQ